MRRFSVAMIAVGLLAGSVFAGPVERSRDAKLLDILLERDIITSQEHAELNDLDLSEPEERRTDLQVKVEDIVSRGLAEEHEEPVGYKKGFYIDAGEKFSLRVNGRVQVRYTYMDYDVDRTMEDTSSFDTPRVRLDFSGHAFDENLNYRIQTDLDDNSDGGRTVLKDAWIQWGNPSHGYAVRAGQFKVPFGRQALTSSSNLQFVDRAGSAGFFSLGRDVGVMLHGDCADGVIGYAAGVFNGEGEELSNDHNEHLGAARIQINPTGAFKLYEGDVKESEDLGVSFGANIAYHPMSLAQGMPIFGIMTESDQTSFGVDAALRYGGLSLQGEVFASVIEDQGNNGLDDVNDTGFYVQGGFFFSEDLEIAGRYSMRNHEDDNTGADDDFEEITVGLNYYMEEHWHKLQLDVSRLTFEPGGGGELEDNVVRLQWQLKF